MKTTMTATQPKQKATEAPREILSKPYRRLLTPDMESGGYTATIHEFPGCVAHGDSANEALQNLDDAASNWIEAALQTGFPIPEPAEYGDFSGKIALRISRRLHKMAAERAEREAVSTNQLLSTAIAHYLGQADGLAMGLASLNSAAMMFVWNFWPSSNAINSFTLKKGADLNIVMKPLEQLQYNSANAVFLPVGKFEVMHG